MIDSLRLNISSALDSYSVIFSDRTNLEIWPENVDVFLVDSFFKDRLIFPNNSSLIWIEANEGAKSLPAIVDIFIELKKSGIGRKSNLMAIGGGVVQDIATFVSSLYMRGIKWSYMPTTFLGMTDSCLGGKSSINVGPYKNLVGNFYPPVDIEILPNFVRSLPRQEIVGGVAEAAKISFCKGEIAFKKYEELVTPLMKNDWVEKDLVELLYMVLSVKKWFIEKDEFDKAERRLLNFGHTWGHALESATSFKIPHGIAICIGMMASIRFVSDQYSVPSLWNHCSYLLQDVINSSQIDSFKPALFLSTFYSDKKHSSRFFHLIVPINPSSGSNLGVHEIKVAANNFFSEKVLNAMEETLSLISDNIINKKILKGNNI